MKIADYQIISHGADYSGIVFQKDNRIFRGIRPGFEEHIKKQFECGLFDELMKKGLIPKTTLTDHTTDEFPLILEHEKIPVIVLPCYWSFSMIKDAAILTLQVNQIANKYGYQLIDSHFGISPFIMENQFSSTQDHYYLTPRKLQMVFWQNFNVVFWLL